MLGWLAHTTVTVAVLAGVVALVCRLGRFRPAVRHALWLLVLLKMMMPPVVAWQVPLPDWGRLLRSAVWPVVPPSVTVPHERQLEGPTSFVLVPPGAPGKIAAPPTRPQSVDRPVSRGSQPEQGHSTNTRTGAATTDRLWNPASIGTWLGDLWLASVAVVALVILLRIERFRRVLRWGQLAPWELAQQIHDLAARMRLRPPSSLLLPGLTTPCLWCWGKPKLLLPAALMDRFSPECRRGVLAHELAHLRRRDHWVAWLQLAATCLWWWNPLFWWVRRQVRENAELACDAWVVHTLPDCRRAYAEALLEVCRLNARAAAPVPALGMGSRHRRTLERRLTMIMQGPGTCRVHLLGIVAVGLLALIVLPGWSDGQKAEDGRKTEPAKAASERGLEAALKAAQVNGKYEMLLRQFRVPEDVDNYSEFNDYGPYQGTSYAGQNDLPPGYWVYVAPYWYIWRDLSATPKVKRAWGPEQATGAPDTDGAGDLQTAWASRTPDGQDEWLLLEYAELVVPREIQVYETYNPGALYRVTVFQLDGTEVEVWKGKDPTPVGSERGISKIPVKVSFKTNRVKIYLASKDVPGWNEIDAVGVVDTAGKTHWARSADASSTYAEMMRSPIMFIPPRAQTKRPWGPEQVIGPPDTPEAGDFGTAWASLTEDGQDEWLQTEYAEEVFPKEVHVYETYNPGALYKVSVFKPDGTEMEVWKGKDPTPIGSGKGVSVIPIKVNFKTKRIKIYLASKDVPGWNEIDAIGLKDTTNRIQWAVSATASSTYAQPTTNVNLTNLLTEEQIAMQQRLAQLEAENRQLKIKNQQLMRMLEEKEKKKAQQKQDK